MKRHAVGTVLLVVLLAGCRGADPDVLPVRLTIPSGATLTAVAESLSSHGIVSSARWFRLYATLTGRQREIQAGTYDLKPGTPMRAVLKTLVTGRVATDPLNVPEGLMLEELADQVREQIGMDPDSLLVAARDSALRARMAIPSETLEGYLYPSTYYVRHGATALEIVGQMLSEFEARWRPEWNSRLTQLGWRRHDIVILASIVEGEVRDRTESRTISSVYHNRMRLGMRLQADPTVIYVLGRRRRLFERDYEVQSPYNTYLIDGLPPGPVNQPSAASLEAALYPEETEYLYFVAGPDGRHVFSRTFAEHLVAVREVRRIEAGNSGR